MIPDDRRDPFDGVNVDIAVRSVLSDRTFGVLIKIALQDIIVHPEYKPRYKYFDIALIKLTEPALLAYNIWPACLVPESMMKFGTDLTVAGFGRNDAYDSK